MTATTAVGRQITPGHLLSYSTLRNAKSAEWLTAARHGRRCLPPAYCEACNGWHLTPPATVGGDAQ